jgi:DNA-binding SARP family transcriptional activator
VRGSHRLPWVEANASHFHTMPPHFTIQCALKLIGTLASGCRASTEETVTSRAAIVAETIVTEAQQYRDTRVTDRHHASSSPEMPRSNEQPITHHSNLFSAFLEIRLFGMLEVRVDGDKGSLGDDTRARLLALLALEGECFRETLCSRLWPGVPRDSARTALRTTLTRLRADLKDEGCRLISSGDPVRLSVSEEAVDARAFRFLVQRGTPEALKQAVELYSRGPLLDGCREPWVEEYRAKLAGECIRALQALAKHEAAEGDAPVRLDYLRRAAQIDPLREDTRRALMQALQEQGDHDGAFHQYEELRECLARNGREPRPETKELYQRLREAAALVTPPRAATSVLRHQERARHLVPVWPWRSIKPWILGIFVLVGSMAYQLGRYSTSGGLDYFWSRPALANTDREYARTIVRLTHAAMQNFKPIRGPYVERWVGFFDEYATRVRLPLSTDIWEEPRVRNDELWRMRPRPVSSKATALHLFKQTVSKTQQALKGTGRPWKWRTRPGSVKEAGAGSLQWTAWNGLEAERHAIIKVTMEPSAPVWIVKIHIFAPGKIRPADWGT